MKSRNISKASFHPQRLDPMLGGNIGDFVLRAEIADDLIEGRLFND